MLTIGSETLVFFIFLPSILWASVYRSPLWEVLPRTQPRQVAPVTRRHLRACLFPGRLSHSCKCKTITHSPVNGLLHAHRHPGPRCWGRALQTVEGAEKPLVSVSGCQVCSSNLSPEIKMFNFILCSRIFKKFKSLVEFTA